MKKIEDKLKMLNFAVLIFNLIFTFLFLRTAASISWKPILYLYPEENQTIEVKLANDYLIRTSYPKYNNGWKVEADANGNLRIGDKNYYALYWDEDNTNIVDFKEGFYVEADNAIEFLEEKLNLIGLSEREANEFIMYWLPVLEENKRSLVYFELTEERERNNKLIISPSPDSLLRLIIHIKKIRFKPTNLKEQTLTTFERTGFVAVEWGGVKYN